ncbi:MAG: hypothetical protein R6U93_03445 [Dehalococcoidia bacterium]
MGIRKLSIFVTADALLAAVLLVWAQIWLNLPRPPGDWVLGYGLTWSFMSILLALAALAIAVLASITREGHDSAGIVPDLAVALFATSLIMGIFNIGQSFTMALAKSISGMPATQSPVVPPVTHQLAFGILLLVAFGWILVCSIRGTTKRRYLWWTRLVAILVMGIALVMTVYSLRALCLGEDRSYRIFFWALIGISGSLFVGFSTLLALLWRSNRLTKALGSGTDSQC